MTAYIRVFQDDCLVQMRTMPKNSVDSIVTDPPYGLEFMGKEWDAPWQTSSKSALFGKRDRPTPGWATTRNPNCQICHGRLRGPKPCSCETPSWDEAPTATNLRQMRALQEWCEDWARECLRVLKPGGHIAAFSGTRTYHRMACAIEDSGFEVRDQLAWTYGQGFPKSLNVGNGWGTALKPAWEPICLARKPLSEKTVAANVLRWGTGAINVDGCRVESEQWAASGALTGGASVHDYGDGLNNSGRSSSHALGRFPANLCHDGSQEVLDLFPETKSGALHPWHNAKESDNGSMSGKNYEGSSFGDDSGSTARFFYCAKASKADRAGSKHPTVKPIKLMQWLCRMVTPPGGTVLDPFAGTGTTGEAAQRENFDAILIEREVEHFADSIRRLGLEV